jgi:hypothetical protein
LKDKLRKRLTGGGNRSEPRPLNAVSVIYQLVSNVPSACAELENRNSLAVMAALGGGPDLAVASGGANRTKDGAEEAESTGDGETFIERYSRGISAVDTILFLDRLRQNVAVKEALKAAGKQGLLAASMRKTVSVPNFSSMTLTGSRSMDNLALSAALAPPSRMSSSFTTTRLRTSMSVHDFDQSTPELSGPPLSASRASAGGGRRTARGRGLATVPEGGGDSGCGNSNAFPTESLPPRPTFLNLGTALSSRQRTNQRY